MSDAIDLMLAAPFWVAVLRTATPLLFGTLGVLLCERAGVLNLGIEGILVAGAFVGWLAVQRGADPWGGLAAAALVGAAFGALHAALTVPLALSQHVAGLGITMLATGLAHFGYRVAFPAGGTPPRGTTFAPLAELAGVPLLGPVLAGQTAPTLLAIAAVPLLGWILYRTPLGLALRAVGENPDAADAQGIDPIRVRAGAVIAGSALMAVGGAFLTLSAFDAFFVGMVNGRGWICVALVVFAGWRPGRALAGALLFAAFDALQLRLQQSGGGALPYQAWLALPYLLSILALVLMARRAESPQALMRPWRRGER